MGGLWGHPGFVGLLPAPVVSHAHSPLGIARGIVLQGQHCVSGNRRGRVTLGR